MPVEPIDLHRLQAAVEALTKQRIHSRRRFAVVVRARDIFVRAARDDGATWQAIGGFLGGYDHSTVITAYRRATGRYSKPEWATVRIQLSQFIGATCCPTCGQKIRKS